MNSNGISADSIASFMYRTENWNFSFCREKFEPLDLHDFQLNFLTKVGQTAVGEGKEEEEREAFYFAQVSFEEGQIERMEG